MQTGLFWADLINLRFYFYYLFFDECLYRIKTVTIYTYKNINTAIITVFPG